MSFKLFGLGKLNSSSYKKGSLRRCCLVFGSKSMGISLVSGAEQNIHFRTLQDTNNKYISSQVCHHSLLFFFGPLSNMIPPQQKTYHAFFAVMAMKRPLFLARRFAGGPGCHLLVQELRCILGRGKLPFAGWWAECMHDLPWKVNNGHVNKGEMAW